MREVMTTLSVGSPFGVAYSVSMATENVSTKAARVATRAQGSLDSLVTDIESVENPWDRSLVAGQVLQALVGVNEELRAIRNQAVQELSEEGFSYRQIAAWLGLSLGRVQQMRNDDPGPRRRGKIEIAVEQRLSQMPAQVTPEEKMRALFPVILSFRHGTRVPAKRVAEMLDVPVSVVRKPWAAAVEKFHGS